MALKLIIYIFVIVCLLLSQYKFLLLDRLGITDKIFALISFGIYLFLLFVEIKSRIVKGAAYVGIRRIGFIFSGLTGIFWCILLSLPERKYIINTPLDIIELFVGVAICGFLGGLIGWGFTKLMWKYGFKKV